MDKTLEKPIAKKKKSAPKVNLGKIFKEGLAANNPVFVQMVGMCSVLAISGTLTNALVMGMSVTFVVVMSNFVISILRDFISNEIRIPAFIVIIAGFVTIVQMVIKAYLPALDKSLGIFIPLIVVNCLILARAEGFASQNRPFPSIIDGLGQGLGYTIAICILAFFRELFGAGTLFGISIIPAEFTIGFLQQPASSFIVLGMLVAAFNAITSKKKESRN